MVRFSKIIGDEEIISTLSKQLTWSHFTEILMVKDPLAREFYTQMCYHEKWSVRTLRDRIRSMERNVVWGGSGRTGGPNTIGPPTTRNPHPSRNFTFVVPKHIYTYNPIIRTRVPKTGLIGMNLHNILDDLFSSGSKVRILRLVFRFEEREFTEREIAQMIKMSPNTVNLAMADLGSTNVLRFKRIGRTNICQVNRSSVLYPVLRDLFDFERGALEDLYSRIADVLPKDDKALIFGSYARGEMSPDSDLDVLIIAKNKEKTQDVLDDLVFSIIRTHSVVVSPVILSKEEFEKQKGSKRYIKNALADGVWIQGEA